MAAVQQDLGFDYHTAVNLLFITFPLKDSWVLRMVDSDRLDLAITTSIGIYYNCDPIRHGFVSRHGFFFFGV